MAVWSSVCFASTSGVTGVLVAWTPPSSSSTSPTSSLSPVAGSEAAESSVAAAAEVVPLEDLFGEASGTDTRAANSLT